MKTRRDNTEPRITLRQRLRQRQLAVLAVGSALLLAGAGILGINLFQSEPGQAQVQEPPSYTALPVTFHVPEVRLDTAGTAKTGLPCKTARPLPAGSGSPATE